MKKIISLLLFALFSFSLTGCKHEVPPLPYIPEKLANIFVDSAFDNLSMDNKNSISIENIKIQSFYNELSNLKLSFEEEPLNDLPVIHKVYFLKKDVIDDNGKSYINFCGEDDKIAYAYVFYNGIRLSIEKNLDAFNELISFILNEIQQSLDNNPVPFESLECITYVDGDTYTYESVHKYYSLNLTYEDFCIKFNLLKENDFYVVDDYSKWLEVYCDLNGGIIDPVSYEEGNKPYLTSVNLVIRRTARASNQLAVVYQIDTTNNKLKVSFPYESVPGDKALFNCFDLVTIPRNVFYRLYPEYDNSQIKFELINDLELLSFYSDSTFINDTNGFYPIMTYQNIGTTTRLAKVHERYNEDYFKEYSLGIVKFATCSSETGILLNKIKYEDGKIITIFDINSEYVNTKDEFYINFVFQVKKENIKSLTESSYEIDIKVNNTLHPEIGSYHYEKYEEKKMTYDFDNITDENLKYLAENAPKFYKDMGNINNKQYGRVINSSSSKENVIQVATNYFTDVRYSSSTNIVVDCYLDVETPLYYGVYVKWEHNSSGRKSYYDEYVISFKNEICDFTPQRDFLNQNLKIIFNTNDIEIIRDVMDYLYYNNIYNIGGYKLFDSIISETEKLYQCTFYALETCYGDWDEQDEITLCKRTFLVDKKSGEVGVTNTIIKTIYIDSDGISK